MSGNLPKRDHAKRRDSKETARPASGGKNQGQGGRAGDRGAEDHAGLAGQAAAHDHAAGLQAGRRGRSALLLSSQAADCGQLPHVPGGIWHARHRPGPQAGAQSRRHAQDHPVGFALRTGHAARRDCLRHAHFPGNGDLSQLARDPANARGGAGIAADQSSAGLSDLRSGGGMQIAGILRAIWPGGEPLC